MGSQPFQSASQASRQHLQASKRAATASHASQRPRWHLRRQTAKQKGSFLLGSLFPAAGSTRCFFLPTDSQFAVSRHVSHTFFV